MKEVDSDYIHPAFSAFMDRYGLTLEDAVRWYFVARAEMLALQADLEFGEVEFVRRRLEEILIYPDMALFWENSSSEFTDEFIELVSEMTR